MGSSSASRLDPPRFRSIQIAQTLSAAPLPPHSQCVADSIRMHPRTATEKDVLVVTEGCKDVAASALLEKDPNTTAGNFVNMIRSLLPAAIALYKEELVLVSLSPQQVFWTGDTAKLLLPRFHRIGERTPYLDSPFHSLFFPPQVRLWNWTASEYDSVYVRTVFLLSTRRLDRSSTTICIRSATSTRSSARTPLLPTCLPAGGCSPKPARTGSLSHPRRTISPLSTACVSPCTAAASSTGPRSPPHSACSTASSSQRRPCPSPPTTAGRFPALLFPLSPSPSSPCSSAAPSTATTSGSCFRWAWNDPFTRRRTAWRPICCWCFRACRKKAGRSTSS